VLMSGLAASSMLAACSSPQTTIPPISSAPGVLASCDQPVPFDPGHTAQSFVDSVGVNVHLADRIGPYSNSKRVVRLVEYLGVKHVRDVLHDSAHQAGALRALASVGVDADLIANLVTPQEIGDWMGYVNDAIVAALELPKSVVGSIEGPNEFDKSGAQDWPVLLREIQTYLYQTVVSIHALSHALVVAPALSSSVNPAELGDLSDVSDVGNLHAYPPGGQEPESNVDVQLGRAIVETPARPVWVTETGYNDASITGADGNSVTDATEAVYIPRIVAENYAAGIARTYLYELLDDPNVGESTKKAHFGLFRSDGSAKPAAIALRNLLSMLMDRGSRGVTEPASVSTSATPSDFHELLLAKHDHSAWLLMWRSESVWNPQMGQGTSAPSSAVEVCGPRGSQVTLYAPSQSENPLGVGTTRASVNVGPELVVAEVAPRA